MSNFNRIILVGRLTRDPEIKYTPTGTQIANFSLAVSRVRSKNKETDFFNIVAWQRLAEICEQYLKKGSLVLIEGEVHQRQYETQDGQKRTVFEINAQNLQMLGSKSDAVAEASTSPSATVADQDKPKPKESAKQAIFDDEGIEEFDPNEMPF